MAQVLLDPHARTFDGFLALVAREWVARGHPFAARNDFSLAFLLDSDPAPAVAPTPASSAAAVSVSRGRPLTKSVRARGRALVFVQVCPLVTCPV